MDLFEVPVGTNVNLSTIYIASKTRHALHWRAMRDRGWKINSSWIDQAGEGETSDWEDLWDKCIGEASRCGRLVVYLESGERLKGAIAEVGAALANGIPVFVVGDPKGQGSWWRHRLVFQCETLFEAFTRSY